MLQRRTDDNSVYLTVSEAAEFLGVSPWTLRNWDKAGRLKPRRHPKNGYRIYSREELKAILGPDSDVGNANEKLTPRVDWSDMGDSEHFVQFYENDAFLMDSVTGFIGSALTAGEGAVVVATRAHRNAIQKRLSARGIDIENGLTRGQYQALDAAETLAKLMVGDMPDRQRFDEVIGAVLATAASRGRHVRAFGEMVALLWADGNAKAAIRLEELWNEMSRTRSFALFCAYPLDGFTQEIDGVSLNHVCAHHTRVIPAESYASLACADERVRAIANLQQKAALLEAEVAQRKQAEEALRESERHHRTLMELLPAAVYTCDAPSGFIRYFNRHAAELWGREPVTGDGGDRYCGSLRAYQLDGTPLPLAEAPMAQVLNGGPPIRNSEVVIERPDGSRIIAMVNIDPITTADGTVVGAVNLFQDVTERKAFEHQLRAAKASAEEASRSKDQFLAVLSHELRTPLTPVLMTVAALESEPSLPAQVQKELSMIRRNISLETRLIDDLLDLSRVVNGKMTLQKQETDVHPLIANVVEMVRSESQQKQMKVELELNAKSDRVSADSARLHQVLWNLLINAIKFTPAQGTITVRTRNDAGNGLVIEITDTGMGIESAVLPRIFNAFDQGAHGENRTLGGLGLGLAICKAVVEMHEGNIRASSRGMGQGSCFTVELPTVAVTEPETSEKQPPARNGNGHSRSLRILLVDDHLDTLRVLERLLQTKGHAVVTASTVTEAVRQAEIHRFDILISDIGLPDGTGHDIMRQVRLRYPKLPGIALTGYGMDQDVRNSEDAGFQVHMTKPLDLKQLEVVFGRLALA